MNANEWCRSEIHDKPIWELTPAEHADWVRDVATQMQGWIALNGGCWEEAKWNLPGYRPVDPRERGFLHLRRLRRQIGMPLLDD